MTPLLMSISSPHDHAAGVVQPYVVDSEGGRSNKFFGFYLKNNNTMNCFGFGDLFSFTNLWIFIGGWGAFLISHHTGFLSPATGLPSKKMASIHPAACSGASVLAHPTVPYYTLLPKPSTVSGCVWQHISYSPGLVRHYPGPPVWCGVPSSHPSPSCSPCGPAFNAVAVFSSTTSGRVLYYGPWKGMFQNRPTLTLPLSI